MPTPKDLLDKEVQISLAEGDSEEIAARRLFLFRTSPILQSHASECFRIIDEVSTHFRIPFRAVSISGSAQMGYSYVKARDFEPGESDLDLAIVDSGLFLQYCEIVYTTTRAYTDLTKFPVKDGVSTVGRFRKYLCRGYFRPDLMPYGEEKQEWFGFFNRLSQDYLALFKNINGGVFLSQKFFEGKQVPTMRQLREENK